MRAQDLENLFRPVYFKHNSGANLNRARGARAEFDYHRPFYLVFDIQNLPVRAA